MDKELQLRSCMEDAEYMEDLLDIGLVQVEKKNFTIGLLLKFEISLFLEGYFAELLAGLVKSLKQTPYELRLITVNENDDPAKILKENQVDAMVVLNWLIFSKLKEHVKTKGVNTKICLIDEFFPQIKANIVYCDGFEWGYKATEYLIKKGCKHIAHIKGEPASYDSKHRYLGYEAALKKYRLTPMSEIGYFYPERGYEAAKKLLNKHKKIDGIFSSNDNMAIGALKALKEKGIDCPKEIKVIGYDGIKLGECSKPSLTTVVPDLEDLGHKVVDILCGPDFKQNGTYFKKKYKMKILQRESA